SPITPQHGGDPPRFNPDGGPGLALGRCCGAAALALGAERCRPHPRHLARRGVRRRIEPAAQVAYGNARECRDPGRMLVEGGTEVKLSAPRFEEGLPALDPDLL